jgi:Family of unknown function (DUF5681)
MGKWARGQSGNPGGRPKLTRKMRYTVTELARDAAPKAIRTLITVMSSRKSTMTARAIAADRILDRAYGKAPQAVAVLSAPGRPIEHLSDEELMAIITGSRDEPLMIEGEVAKEGKDG